MSFRYDNGPAGGARADVLKGRGVEEGPSAMAGHSIPHFHNDLGVPTIKVRVKEFMCTGAKPPFDHPHIFIDMGSENEAVCSYCSTRYVYDADLAGVCAPPECELQAAA